MAKAKDNNKSSQRKGSSNPNTGKKPTTRKAPKTNKTSKSQKGTASSRRAASSASGKRTGTLSSKGHSGDMPPQLSSQKFSIASKNASQYPSARSSERTGATSSGRRTVTLSSSRSQSSTSTGVSGRGGSASSRSKAATSGNRNVSGVGKRSAAKHAPARDDVGGFARFVGLVRQLPYVMVPLLVAVVLVIGYTVVDIASSLGKIHPGVSVQGVDVGGMSTSDAAAKLNETLTPQLNEAHITLYQNADIAAADGVVIESNSGIEKAYADQTSGSDVNKDGVTDKWTVTAETIGAYVDGQALAEEAYRIGREGNFIAERFGAWFGGKPLVATVAVSDERFNALISEINTTIGKPIVDSTIGINGGAVTVVTGSNGTSVEKPQFIKSFSKAAFDSNHPYCTIPMQTDPMHITSATAQRVADAVSAAIAEDVKIIYNEKSWVMNRTDLGNVINQSVLDPNSILTFGNGTQHVVQKTDETINPYDVSYGTDADSGYVLQAFVDQEKMDAYLVGILGDAAKGTAQNARFDTSSGEVVIVDSVEGSGPDRWSAELTMQDMLFGTQTGTLSDRTITLVDTVIQPEFTTEMARSMGITERLASWSIPLSGSSDRIHNIELLCELINNSLVAPGEEWSFNGRTGERTAEKGFGTAPVIINGKHEDQLGGGICQVATCVYNAACFSGLGIAERVNHDFYISSYDDDGFADATVSWEKPDLRWVNDMSTYVLLTAETNDEDVIISFWGTKDGRTVECQRGEWKEGEKYKRIQENSDQLPAGTTETTQTGQDGKSIDIRYLCKAANGEVLHDITFHSVYSAQNEIVTVGTGAAG